MPRLAKKLVLVENENEHEGHAVADEQVTSVVHAVAREDVVADEAIAEEAVAEDTVVENDDEAQDETGREDETESEAAGVDEDTGDAETRTIAVSAVAVSAVAASAGETGREQGSSDGTSDDDASTAPAQRPDEFRLLEALLFASKEPLDEATLAKRLPQGADVRGSLRALQLEYAPRGVNLVRIGRKWTFRTAGDLAWLLTKNVVQTRKLSRAAIETLAIIAYHQPVTRAEVEEIRGVAAAKGTLDVLLETGWIRPRGRRKVPGRPITYGTSEVFLSHFGLEQIDDLPGLDELKGAGLLDGRIPPGFAIPVPSDDSTLRDDEDPLEPGDLLDLGLAPPPERTETD